MVSHLVLFPRLRSTPSFPSPCPEQHGSMVGLQLACSSSSLLLQHEVFPWATVLQGTCPTITSSAAAEGLPWYLELLYFWPGCSQSCSSHFLPHSQAAFALSPTHFHRGAIAFAGRLSCGLRCGSIGASWNRMEAAAWGTGQPQPLLTGITPTASTQPGHPTCNNQAFLFLGASQK